MGDDNLNIRNSTVVCKSKFTDTEVLYESNKSKIVFSVEPENGQAVVKKILNSRCPSSEEVLQFNNEYNLTSQLHIPGVRKAISCNLENQEHVLTLEFVEGCPLKEVICPHGLSVGKFLSIATQITKTLAQIHDYGLIHWDITCHNILFSPEQDEIRIIDFGSATRVVVDVGQSGNSLALEATLEYMSPEQTGRINRKVDYRSDLYSLGVAFFEMLTGKLPLHHPDASVFIHSLIACMPERLHERDSSIPPVISEIIHVLLAKNPEERYQSAWGLYHDLEKCKSTLTEVGAIPAFELSNQLHYGKLTISEKLYGREKECEQILNVFDRIARGAKELLLVNGASGIGKSALILQLMKPVFLKQGNFISGKCDHLQRQIPYYAILQALKEFVSILLTEPESKLLKLKEDVLSRIGSVGKVLTDLVPDLQMIIGAQSDIPVLQGHAAENRFHYVFGEFIEAISTHERPLVIFIDDLQWMDLASLRLMSALLRNPGLEHFLLIGAYRDHEIPTNHFLSLEIPKLEAEKIDISHIQLQPIDVNAIAHLLADLMEANPKEMEKLAAIVLKKTQGTPLFINKFLDSLLEKGLISFDSQTKQRLEWNEAAIIEVEEAENVVQLLTKNLTALPSETQEILSYAACIGNIFDLSTLCAVGARKPKEVAAILWPAVENGFIRPMDTGYVFALADLHQRQASEAKCKFVHDQIHAAVYKSLPQETSKANHFLLGTLWLEKLSDHSFDTYLFDIAGQFYLAKDLIQTSDQNNAIVKVFLKAGKKANDNLAYASAFNFYQAGIDLLGSDKWVCKYDTALELYTGATHSAFLSGNFEQMESHAQEVLKHATTPLDKLEVNITRLRAMIVRNELVQAVDEGLRILQKLKLRLPPSPGYMRIQYVYLKAKWAMYGKSIQSLEKAAALTDPLLLAQMKVLATIGTAIYIVNYMLCPIAAFHLFRITVKLGFSPMSPYIYGSYGLIQAGIMGNFKSGYAFSELGIKISDRKEASFLKGRATFIHYFAPAILRDHISKSIEPLREGYKYCLEAGDPEFAAYTINVFLMHQLYSGMNLFQVYEEIRTAGKVAMSLKQEIPSHWYKVLKAFASNLMGKSPDPLLLLSEGMTEEQIIDSQLKAGNKSGTFHFYFSKMMLAVILNVYDVAIENARKAEKYLDSYFGTYHAAIFFYFDSLAFLATAIAKPECNTLFVRRRIRKNQAKLRKLAKNAPMNFHHKYVLVEALRCQLKGNMVKAQMLFDEAIDHAIREGFTMEVGLADEFAGKFFLSQKKSSLGSFFLSEAFSTFQKWGCIAKTKQMEREYPDLLGGALQGDHRGSANHTLSVLDLNAAIKASATLSKEVRLEPLLISLMKIVMENSGAQKAFLLQNNYNELFIEAEGDYTTGIRLVPTLPVKGCGLLAESIINYVLRTGKQVSLDDATTSRFARDPYIEALQPKSLLCIPIFNRGRVQIILYLENNLANGVFPERKSDLINLLSGQIAISVDNALLYENLEEKVQERTNTLKLYSEKIQAQNQYLIQVNEDLSSKLDTLEKERAHIRNELTIIGNEASLLREKAKLEGKLEAKEREIANLTTLLHGAKQQVHNKYYFEDISNSTIINDAALTESMNSISTTHGKSVAHALRDFSQFINGLGNPKIVELFDAFNQEASRPIPRQVVLKTNWEAILSNIGDIPLPEDSKRKIEKLF